MIKFFSIIFTVFLIASNASSALDDDWKQDIIKVENPFKKYANINPELMKAAEFFDEESMTHAEIDAKSMALYDAFINKDTITKTERSLLLILRTTLYHEEELKGDAPLRSELQATRFQILKLNAVPITRLKSVMRSVFLDAYHYGDTNTAINVFMQATKMGYKPRPWDNYILAELLVQLNRTDLALKKLTEVNSLLLEEGCSIPPIWQEAAEKVSTNDAEYIKMLKEPTPHLYNEAPNSRKIPIKRPFPRFPPQAAYNNAGGWILTTFLLTKEGKVNCSFTLEGEIEDKGFVKATKKAISKYEYQIDSSGWKWPITAEIILRYIGPYGPSDALSEKYPNIK